MDFERSELAREVGKSRSALGRCLRELVSKGVCDLEAVPNQHRGSRLQVRPEYWPYEREAERERGVSGQCAAGGRDAGSGREAYVVSVRRMFGKPSCMPSSFGAADERLAADWHRAEVPLETVRRAILLGSVRKSMTLIGRPDGQPIRSLRYFESVLEEVRAEEFPDCYWKHLEFNLGRCEQYWRDKPVTAPGRARPNLEQANPSGKGPSPSSTAQRKAEGETR